MSVNMSVSFAKGVLMIYDTDILIWYLRGNRKAANAVDKADNRLISTITYLEMLQGMKSQRELKIIRDFLFQYAFQILPLHENTGHRAAVYMEQYALTHGIHLADALIAATAVETNEMLFTANNKHYAMIKELQLKIFRPA